MSNEFEVNRAIDKYADMIRRICFVHLKNRTDTEDVFQTVFLKYFLYSGTFENDEHEKAWFIRVTVNACKDLIKSIMRHETVPFEMILEEVETVKNDNSEVLAVLLSLPKKYRDVIYLFYYENYTAVEIAKILNKNENTVYSLLSRGRKILKEELGGADFE